MDISHDIQNPPIKTKITPVLPPMTNSVIQWNCRGFKPNFDELTLLIVKYNENIPQSIVKLNTNLQAVAVKFTAHKTITLCSVYLPPRNHLKFNPKDLHYVIEQLPSPFILMGDLRM